MNQKNVLITGASSLLGSIIIRKLHNKEINFYCQYRTDFIYPKRYSNIKKTIKLDFCKYNSEKLFEEFINKYIDTLDALIHLPSSKLTIKNFQNYSWSEFQEQIDIQVKSLHHLIQNCMHLFKRSQSPKIILIGSKALENPVPKGMASYISVKGMLYYYFMAIKEELKQKKIETLILNPNMFQSPMLDNLPNFLIEKNVNKENCETDKISDEIINFIHR